MPLTEQAAIALEESIAHWERNVAAEMPGNASAGGDCCALCDEFQEPRGRGGHCDGCPVHEKTGIRLCIGTPFVDAYDALKLWIKNDSPLLRDNFRAYAQAELDFLKSLRDPPASPETAPSEALK